VTDDSILNVQLTALNYIATIGVGGFGRVELVCVATHYDALVPIMLLVGVAVLVVQLVFSYYKYAN